MARERIEFDSRVNPILLRIINIYSIPVENNREEFLEEAIKLADSLIPHVKNHDDTLSIADFVPMDVAVELYKRQYWSFEITFNRGREDQVRCEIERTDIWNGSGTHLRISTFQKDGQIGTIHFSNGGLYRLSFISAEVEKERKWVPYLVLEKSKLVGFGKKDWKVVVDNIKLVPLLKQFLCFEATN